MPDVVSAADGAAALGLPYHQSPIPIVSRLGHGVEGALPEDPHLAIRV